MARAYFISDAHLGLGTREEERRKEDRLLSFLREIADHSDYLFIVGDLFDAWFEYRTVIPKGFHRLLAQLDTMAHHRTAIHYLAGNHDYWMRDYFTSDLGMITHTDPFEASVDGKRMYIHHGDGVAAHDTGYRILKTILRNPVNIWLYSWLHPDVGIPLARGSSGKSRRYTSSKDFGESDGMLALAHRKIDEGFDIVVMGHRHEPVLMQIDRGVYINLGDWITHNTYAELCDGRIALKTWNG